MKIIHPIVNSFHPMGLIVAVHATLLLAILHRTAAVTLEHASIGASWVRGMRA